jgi:hypothetical protein
MWRDRTNLYAYSEELGRLVALQVDMLSVLTVVTSVISPIVNPTPIIRRNEIDTLLVPVEAIPIILTPAVAMTSAGSYPLVLSKTMAMRS